MSLRLLVMAAQADHLLLVRKHVEIEWPDAVVQEHRLGIDAPLDAGFAATGFDAVVIVTAEPSEETERRVCADRPVDAAGRTADQARDEGRPVSQLRTQD
jgi:hypothetical protein